MKKTYSAPTIHCHSCAGLITETLEEVAGVVGVAVDLAAKTVTVAYSDPTAEAKVLAALEEEGFKATAL